MIQSDHKIILEAKIAYGEEEHDYLMSDEAVDETIEANEYEFNEDGSRA